MLVRGWTPEDTDELAAWFETDPEMWRYCGFPAPITRGQLDTHLLQRAHEEVYGRAATAAVEDDGSLVGYVTLWPRTPDHGVAHIIVAPWYRGRGRAVAKAGLAYAKTLVPKVIAQVPPHVDPESGARWLRSLGFNIRFYGEL